MRTYPIETNNSNVPKDCFLLSEWKEGETTYTCYCLENGDIYKVGDWKYDKPIPVTLHNATHLTGDSEQMIEFRYRQFYSELNDWLKECHLDKTVESMEKSLRDFLKQ